MKEERNSGERRRNAFNAKVKRRRDEHEWGVEFGLWLENQEVVLQQR